jgi:hypothetical protein
VGLIVVLPPPEAAVFADIQVSVFSWAKPQPSPSQPDGYGGSNWVQGLDLNQRPSGYERQGAALPRNGLARKQPPVGPKVGQTALRPVRRCSPVSTKTRAAAIGPIVAGKDLERQSLRPETALIEGARFESEVGAGPPRAIPHPNFRPDAELRQ